MEKLKDPWLVAAWPGMGLVGHLAAAHLARTLGVEPVTEIQPGDHFHQTKVEEADPTEQTLGFQYTVEAQRVSARCAAGNTVRIHESACESANHFRLREQLCAQTSG